MATPPSYALEVSPEATLTFAIAAERPPPAASDGGEDAGSGARCVMTLTHRGGTDAHLVFKVKTTQPRRYLVRPNQGIVAPGTSETVSILLVDKDRQVLWDTFSRLGQTALDHSKDKFLVQSSAVPADFAAQFADQPRLEGNQYPPALVEALTARWNSLATNALPDPVFNKKLHIRHVAQAADALAAGAAPGGAPGGGGGPAALPPALIAPAGEGASPEQLREEAATLRRKYDELVAFSVHLTAERDILNNTLEQTKRDLNRERASRGQDERGEGTGAGAGGGKRAKEGGGKKGGGVSVVVLLVALALAFVAGIKLSNEGSVDALGKVPVVAGLLGFDDQKLQVQQKVQEVSTRGQDARVDL